MWVRNDSADSHFVPRPRYEVTNLVTVRSIPKVRGVQGTKWQRYEVILRFLYDYKSFLECDFQFTKTKEWFHYEQYKTNKQWCFYLNQSETFKIVYSFIYQFTYFKTWTVNILYYGTFWKIFLLFWTYNNNNNNKNLLLPKEKTILEVELECLVHIIDIQKFSFHWHIKIKQLLAKTKRNMVNEK